MKIGLLIPGFCLAGKGGAEKGAAEVANLLVRAGFAADIICYARNFCAPSYALKSAVRIKPMNIHSNAAIATLSNEGYDALIGYAMRGTFLRILAIRQLLNLPLVIQECTNPEYMTVNILTHRENGCETIEEAFWLRQAMLAHAAAVRFNHPAFAASVASDIRPFIYAFCNPADGAAFETVQQATRKLICVGALRHPAKNGLAAVRAFCEFSTRCPQWELHLYGANVFDDELKKIRLEYPSSTIVDHGLVEQAEKIYQDAYATIIPSINEGLPNVLIESFSYGVPCIGFSGCPGVRDTILHGLNGFLADRFDEGALTEAMVEICCNNVRDKMSRNAREFARANFCANTWRANWLRMLHHAVEGKNCDGMPQRSAAFDQGSPHSALWAELLSSHLSLKQSDG